jgi:hypothetical protein
MAERRIETPGFISGTSSSRYQALDGDILHNACVIPGALLTSRSAAALIPRVGLISVLELPNIRWAWSSYTLNVQFILTGNELRAYNLVNNSWEYGVVSIPFSESSSRPLATDTFTGAVISVDGVGYTVSSGLGVSEITGANWADPSSLGFVDGYVLLSKRASRFFNHSNLNSTDFSNALFTAAMSGDVDNIGGLAVINREVYLFGDRHTEIWWNSAIDANTVFTRQDGRVFAQGILSVNTVVINGVGYNVCRGDSSYGVFAWSGGVKKISVDAVDIDLQHCVSCRMMNSFERNRSMIHVLIDETKLWSYDVQAGVWSTRSYSEPVIDMFKVDGYHYLALASGIHIMDGDTDNGEPINCYKQTSHIHAMGFWIFHDLIEFDVGGVVAELRLDYSDDGGLTWRNSQFSSRARVGEFNRYRFARMGRSRDRVYKLIWSSSNAAGIYYASESFKLGVK